MKKLQYVFLALMGLFILNGCDSTNAPTKYQFNISAQPTEGGTVSPTDGKYKSGAEIEISANPSKGWRFVRWVGDYSGTSSSATVTIDSDMDIIGVFQKKNYPLTVKVEGGGKVSENVIQAKTTEYLYETKVKLTAKPNKGWKFIKWKGDLSGSTNPKTIIVDKAKTITAVFKKKNYILTVKVEGQGTVNQQVIQAYSTEYPYQTRVKLTAKAESGWSFIKWKGALTTSTNPFKVIIDSSITITAVFKNLFYVAKNGVTVKCPNAEIGDSEMAKDITYTKRTRSQITPSNAASTCTSGITNMSELFKRSFDFNKDISSWDVSSVTNMHGMFRAAKSFNQLIGKWNVSNVVDMTSMFYKAKSFNKPIGNWDVSNVTEMEYMFLGAESFNQPISNWNVSSVEDMSRMFQGASSFNKPIGEWNVNNVVDMGGMFWAATSFNQPIGNWDVSSVENMSRMFQGAKSFNQPIGNWDVSKVKYMDRMFKEASNFNQPIGNWDVSSVTDMAVMFMKAKSFNQPIGNWDVSSVPVDNNMERMFYKAKSFNQDISTWCVADIIGEPFKFSVGGPLTKAHKPVWGTCPTN